MLGVSAHLPTLEEGDRPQPHVAATHPPAGEAQAASEEVIKGQRARVRMRNCEGAGCYSLLFFILSCIRNDDSVMKRNTRFNFRARILRLFGYSHEQKKLVMIFENNISF